MLSVCVCVCVWREREKDWGLIVNSNLDTNSNQPNHDTGATALPAQRLGPRGPAPITISDSIVCCVWEDSGGRCTLYHTCQQTRLAQSCVQEHIHTHTLTRPGLQHDTESETGSSYPETKTLELTAGVEIWPKDLGSAISWTVAGRSHNDTRDHYVKKSITQIT